MFKVITKVNGKVAVKDIENDRIIRSLRYAVYECLVIRNLSEQELAQSLNINSELINRFLKSDPNLTGELPRKLCAFFNLDESDYIPTYFEDTDYIPENTPV